MGLFDLINTGVELGRRNIRSAGRTVASYVKSRANLALYGPLPASEEPNTGGEAAVTLAVSSHFSESPAIEAVAGHPAGVLLHKDAWITLMSSSWYSNFFLLVYVNGVAMKHHMPKSILKSLDNEMVLSKAD